MCVDGRVQAAWAMPCGGVPPYVVGVAKVTRLVAMSGLNWYEVKLPVCQLVVYIFQIAHSLMHTTQGWKKYHTFLSSV